MLWKLQQLHLLPVSLGGLIWRLGPCWALLWHPSGHWAEMIHVRLCQHSPSPHSQFSRTGMGGRAATGAPAVTSTRQLWCLGPALYWGRPHNSDPSSLLPAPGMLKPGVISTWRLGVWDRWQTVGHSTTTHLQSAYLPGFKWILLGDIGTYPTVCFELLLLAF